MIGMLQKHTLMYFGGMQGDAFSRQRHSSGVWNLPVSTVDAVHPGRKRGLRTLKIKGGTNQW